MTIISESKDSATYLKNNLLESLISCEQKTIQRNADTWDKWKEMTITLKVDDLESSKFKGGGHDDIPFIIRQLKIFWVGSKGDTSISGGKVKSWVMLVQTL